MNPQQRSIFGIPIAFAANAAIPAEARGMLRWRRIVIGPAFLRLDSRTQQAVLHHEACHIISLHREQRLVWLLVLVLPALVLLPWSTIIALAATGALYAVIQYLAQQQELDADRFAANGGYGTELLGFVKRIGPPPILPTFYPDYETRVSALEKAIQERGNAAKAA